MFSDGLAVLVDRSLGVGWMCVWELGTQKPTKAKECPFLYEADLLLEGDR